MTSAYYDESVRLGREFQENNKSWTGYDVPDTFSGKYEYIEVNHR